MTGEGAALTRARVTRAAQKVAIVELAGAPLGIARAHLRPVSAAAVVRWGETETDPMRTNAELVAMSLCDAAGEPQFPPDELGELPADAIDEVAAWPAAIFVPVLNAALSLNGLGDDPGN